MSDSKKYGYMVLGIVELVAGIYLREIGEAGIEYSWYRARKYENMSNIGLILLISGIVWICLDIVAIYWTNKHIREIVAEEYARIRCQKCGLMLTAGVSVCPRCGTALSAGEANIHQEQTYQGNVHQENVHQEQANQRNVQSNRTAPVNQYDGVPRFCGQCGTHLDENSVFCPNCGKMVANK